jgi:L-serine dehydratase
MAERSSIFDMIGPVMIGPSSSHTAGVVRIGRVAFKLLREEVKEATITFYNSFARTYEGHGSDRAILAGLMNYKTDDERIKEAISFAEEKKIAFSFRSVGNASAMHPNTVRLDVKGDTQKLTVIGVSKGGGVISIINVDSYNCNFSANNHTLIIKADDRKGAISFTSTLLAQEDCNIAEMSVARQGKNKQAAHFIEMDSGIRPITIDYLQSLSWIHDVIYIPNIDL